MEALTQSLREAEASVAGKEREVQVCACARVCVRVSQKQADGVCVLCVLCRK